MPTALNTIALKYKNIKDSGVKDKLKWDEETERFVMKQTMEAGMSSLLIAEVRKNSRKEDYIDSKQPLLLATPNSWYEKWPKIKLEFLLSDTMKSLFEKGYAV